MINLLEETIHEINHNNLKIEDIQFIGSNDQSYRMNWNQYKSIADVKYDNGYGGNEIPSDLIIVFNDGTVMTRDEYDGSEWWKTTSPFKLKETDTYIPITTLLGYDFNNAHYIDND